MFGGRSLNPTPKVILQNELFDEYCRSHFSDLTKEQKNKLPYDIVKKLNTPHRLTFLEKVYVISMAFGVEGYFIMPPLSQSVPTISVRDFVKIRKSTMTISDVEFMLNNIGFTLASKDLMLISGKLNEMSSAPACKYLVKAKNKKGGYRGKFEKYNEDLAGVGDMLFNFLSIAKKMALDNNITLAEFYILLYMKDGRTKHIFPLVEKIKSGFSSSRAPIMKGFPKLHHGGFLERLGGRSRRTIQYRITTRGLALYNELISKYITNF